MLILTLNCGSSSVKYSVMNSETHERLAVGIVERVTIGNSFIKHKKDKISIKIDHECPDHTTAIQLILDTLTHSEHGVIKSMSEIAAVGHRVVHGGEKFKQSAQITPDLLERIRKVAPLAPLHNPPNIQGIEAAQAVLPNIPHVAVFDTAFHQTMPKHAYIYPLPYEWYETLWIRRYGFHGTSHLYVSKRAAALLKLSIKELKIITLHIGNGVSACAIKNGVSVDTSMGFTPLEGLTMGTRCGDIDPAIPMYVMQKQNLSAKEMDTFLNKKSGLLGITKNFTDRRDIKQNAMTGNELCQLAVDIETYRLKKYIGAYAAAMGGVNAIVFTAGVGENESMYRAKTLEGLEFLGIKLDDSKNESARGGKEAVDITTPDSKVKVLVIPTDEELVIVEDTVAILKGNYDNHTRFQYSFLK